MNKVKPCNPHIIKLNYYNYIVLLLLFILFILAHVTKNAIYQDYYRAIHSAGKKEEAKIVLDMAYRKHCVMPVKNNILLKYLNFFN